MVELLTKQQFQEKIFDFEKGQEWKFEGSVPCVIDFYADWCGPCKVVAPIMDELAIEYKDKVNFYKVDTEQEKELAGMFGIQSIPSILFVPMGEKPQMAVGALPKDQLKSAISDVLKVS